MEREDRGQNSHTWLLLLWKPHAIPARPGDCHSVLPGIWESRKSPCLNQILSGFLKLSNERVTGTMVEKGKHPGFEF